MRAHIPGRYAALALLLGGLACAHNKANTDEGSVVAQDTTKAKNDTSAYKSGQRDTMNVPTPADTTQAAPAPTTPDTSKAAPTPADTTQYQPQAAPAPTDTSSYVPQKAPSDTGAASQPTSPAPTPGADSSMSKDTTKSQ
jgi:hypothetical protein